jgi:hypothetical protein
MDGKREHLQYRRFCQYRRRQIAFNILATKSCISYVNICIIISNGNGICIILRFTAPIAPTAPLTYSCLPDPTQVSGITYYIQ